MPRRSITPGAKFSTSTSAREVSSSGDSSLATATAEDAPVLGSMLARANEIATAQGSPDGFRVIINNGRVGNQEVPHLHMHVVGGPDPVGPMLKRL